MNLSRRRMDTQQILLTLRRHEPELKAAGLSHLRLFGSVARGEATTHSDIDLLADFTPGKTITLITLGSFEQRLRDLLGAEVELSSADWLKPHIRERALREAVVAF
jgi:predicted nucleotidyltransferase